MTKNVVFAVVLTVTAVAQEYSGPKCLGSYCLDRKISDHSMFNRIGLQPQSAPNLRCYEEPGKGAFLFFETFDTEPHSVADVLLSTFPNCMHMKEHLSSGDLLSWKTPEGIGLGSAEADVLRAYGEPSSRTAIKGVDSPSSRGSRLDSIYKFIIRGFQTGDRVPPVGDHDLFYRSKDLDDLRAAEFGIRYGKVSWIFLSRNE
jgi:hypothetical protein